MHYNEFVVLDRKKFVPVVYNITKKEDMVAKGVLLNVWSRGSFKYDAVFTAELQASTSSQLCTQPFTYLEGKLTILTAI